VNSPFSIERCAEANVLRLGSTDGTNRLTRACVLALTAAVRKLRTEDPRPLIVAGNEHFFSAGADLTEIVRLDGVEAYRFSLLGQTLMNEVDSFPAPVYAAVRGYCMGGGLDLALACDFRIAHPHSMFGHRGAALGLITGWGGTQRLPRLIGKAAALDLFVAAEKIPAGHALRLGLVQQLAEDPMAAALDYCGSRRAGSVFSVEYPPPRSVAQTSEHGKPGGGS
jgi:enoyl-CoA hydratase